MDLENLKIGFDMLRAVLGIAKDAKDLLPSGPKKDAFDSSLVAAERQIALAEAQIAKALGYQLCQCTFPPQIMLRVGRKTQNYAWHDHLRCPKCDNEYPEPPAPPLPDNHADLV